MGERYEEILTDDALGFVAELVRSFGPDLNDVLASRDERQELYDQGQGPDFLRETVAIRRGDWKCAPLPDDLLDRRVEITGPVDRKMIINALNSGATHFMADFEDANAPTWDNVVQGQLNLRDAVNGTIRFEKGDGRVYELNDRVATLLVRPRGWHLPEKHIALEGRPVPAALVDFGLFFFHNVHALVAKGSGPYFYLPKLEDHLEARLWNDVFDRAQDLLGVERGTIKATVLIETLPAAFRMHEILWELRDHAAGLNCGRWDYIFSYIKTFRRDTSKLTPDRGQITMTQPFMKAYTELVIQTCHRRGVHAMGGMAAQIPIKGDEEANEAALEKVRRDKLREVEAGHDGTWVAHPALVPVAKEVFDAHMEGPNQIHRLREDISVSRADLVRKPEGTRTEEGLRTNVRVGVQYLEAWLRGNGAVPLYHLMEDAATAEISRTQLWQWVHHLASLEDGRTVSADLVQELLDDELQRLRETLGADTWDRGRFPLARDIFLRVAVGRPFAEFLTTYAYDEIVSIEE